MEEKNDEKKKFSIFSPVITFEHREFYEKIDNELNGIFPICNQGRCTAVEISENATEQEQITDLMKKVEDFCGELQDVTKNLFDQFYLGKEDFYRSILNATAYNKINLIDRNLLERTCDVRWWALETAFGDCISFLDSVKEKIEPLKQTLESEKGDSVSGKKKQGKTSSREIDETLDSFLEYAGQIEILIKKEVYREFSEMVKTFMPSWKKGFKENTVKQINIFLKDIETLRGKIDFACDRLEDINNSYTLYRDLIIVDINGFVLANSNKETRFRVLGLNIKEEEWFQKALATNDGTEYFAQDLADSIVENGQDSLVYSTAVRKNSDTNGKVIGAMGVFFDFQGEAKLILEDYMGRNERGKIRDGWYSFFTNEKGKVIGSSDEASIETGSYAHIKGTHRNLKKGEKTSSYAVIEGLDSALFSAKTDGYLEYDGLGWTSHVITPKEDIFSKKSSAQALEIDAKELMNSLLIPQINKDTYLKIQEDKESIQLISLNGIIFASKLGKRGVALSPIFDHITKTGDFVTSKMEDLLTEMAVGELDFNLTALENFAKMAIDLIDRNLFERAADIRWWSTDQYFWSSLEEPSPKKFETACRRLKVINDSYTMYTNLVLADLSGKIVASSKAEVRNELKVINVSNQSWFQQALKTSQSSQFTVQDVCNSNLEKHKEMSLIYSGGVRKNGSREGEPIGILGVLFDWDTEAGTILENCLPSDKHGDNIDGSAAFYTNSDSIIIETTDKETFPVGHKIEMSKKFTEIGKGECVSGFFNYKERSYIIGSSRTKGYREYEGLKWCAHVVRPVN